MEPVGFAEGPASFVRVANEGHDRVAPTQYTANDLARPTRPVAPITAVDTRSPFGEELDLWGCRRGHAVASTRLVVSEIAEHLSEGEFGGPCDDLAGFPRSFHQVRLALRIRDAGARRPVLLYSSSVPAACLLKYPI